MHPASAQVPLAAIVDARVAAEDAPTCIAVATLRAGSVERVVRCAPAASARLANDAIVEIGSISKAFLGVLLADASVRGEVKLDDPLGKYLPPDIKVPSFNGTTITLLDLATHNAGLPRLPPGLVPTNPLDPYSTLTTGLLLDSLAATRLDRAPGDRYEYSNFGAMLLSLALSRAAGKPFDVLLAERITGPLGMRDTFVAIPAPARARLAQGHSPDGRPVPAWTIEPQLAGVGMISSTLDDMLKFAAANLSPPDNALGRAIALSQRQQRTADGGAIALMWHLRPTAAGPIVWHNGGTGGFRSMLAIDRARGVAAFAIADTANGVDDLPFHLIDPGLPLKAKRVTIAFEKSWLDEYAGRFQLAPNFTLTFVARDGRLFAQVTGQGEFEVFAQARDRIYWKVVPASAVFVRDESGRVVALEFTQGGRTTRAAKLP